MTSARRTKSLTRKGLRIQREAQRHYRDPARCSNRTATELARVYQRWELEEIDRQMFAHAF